MKTIKFNAVMASILGAGALLLSVPVVSNAASGQGWDAFNAGASGEGAGESLPAGSQAYMGTSQGSAAGQGWDAFNAGASGEGAGQAIPVSDKPYQGASLEAAPSGDSDAFVVGAR